MMRAAFTDEQEITAAPEAVWAALTDWAAAPQWMPGVESMRADGPLAIGTVLTFTARGKERTSIVAALEPGAAITLRSVVGGVSAEYAYSVRSGDRADASRVGLDAKVATHGIMTLFASMIRRAIAKEDGVQLARLKAWVEETRSGVRP
jgi:carbon monoxide dehydrogenase subunit G